MSLVFVYGTLRKGEGNHRLLAGRARFVGQCKTAPEFTMRSTGWYPIVSPEGTTSIVGEVYDVDAATLRDLDSLEGHPRFYQRTPINVCAMTEDLWLPVEVYLMRAQPNDTRPLVASGDWVPYVRSQENAEAFRT